MNLEQTWNGLFTKVDMSTQTGGSISAETKGQAETVILEELLTRFDRAYSAEVCGGALLDLLGY